MIHILATGGTIAGEADPHSGGARYTAGVRPVGALLAAASLSVSARFFALPLFETPQGRWFADLTRIGVDLAEYTIPCEPGIARPEKYW